MFGMSGTELAIVLLLALLLLGPSKLPELARSLGKGLREFKKSTEDLRTTVESEFYRMDQAPPTNPAPEKTLAERISPPPAQLPTPGGALHASPNLKPAAEAIAQSIAAPAAPVAPAAETPSPPEPAKEGDAKS